MKIYFTDFWVGLQQKDNFIYNVLCKHFDLEIDEYNPEVLFFSCYGNHHLSYSNCIKVYYTGENDTPNFSWCDYAMGFDDLSFGDRYLRLPEYAIQPKFKDIFKPKFVSEDLFNRKFCNFVYSNNTADPMRNKFFHMLSEYKQVDSGGVCENNMGTLVKDKLEFLTHYKFTIAFENSVYPGYTTEKLIEPMVSMSLPIYRGNPDVGKDFNVNSFIWLHNDADCVKVIDEIIYLDTHFDKYLEKLNQPWTINNPYQNVEDLIYNFLAHIFEEGVEKSLRYPRYGFTSTLYNDFILGKIDWENRRKGIPDPQPKVSLLKKIKRFINKKLK